MDKTGEYLGRVKISLIIGGFWKRAEIVAVPNKNPGTCRK